MLWVAVAVVGFGYYQYVTDVFGLSQSWTFLKPMYSSAGFCTFPRVPVRARAALPGPLPVPLPLGILLVRFVRQKKASLFEKIVLVATLALFMVSLSRGAMLGLLLALTATLVVARSWPLLKHLALSAVPAMLIVLALLLLAGAVQEAETVAQPGGMPSAGPRRPSPPRRPTSWTCSHPMRLI